MEIDTTPKASLIVLVNEILGDIRERKEVHRNVDSDKFNSED